MVRLIKRYGSRKLYDTEESRYVGRDEIAGWIREGQQVRVVDNATSEDVTTHTLTQIISDLDRRGRASLPSDLLHELIRRGEELVSGGVGQLQDGVGRLVRASIDRIGPVRRMREEADRLRERLERLESSLRRIEQGQSVPSDDLDEEVKAAGAKKAARKKTTTRKRA